MTAHAKESVFDSSSAFSLLRRLTFGPRIGDIGWLNALGLRGWLDSQLAPDDAQDKELNNRLASFELPIRYAAGPGTVNGNGVMQNWSAVDEHRPLTYLGAPIQSIWKLTDRNTAMSDVERHRPRDEVIAATLLRAVYSRWQLREILVHFWHNHFNVDAYSSDQIAVALPTYDRDVIRTHALGNFRDLLEAVATSTAMQYYLSNRSSRAGAANENYARELFELHTLGREVYLNDRYDRWREVPGAEHGQPVGYIDQDVYEAARAFTGWTIEDGSRVDSRTQLPSSGNFTYIENWHDGYQKRVLATDFDPFQAPLADGRKVLDLVASHPATARFIARKLCVCIIGTSVSDRTVEAAADAFKQFHHHPKQIALVVKTIILSKDFESRAPKVQKPLALMASFVRATNLEFLPSEGLVNQLASCGQRLFGCPTPNGFPDDDSYWMSANTLRQRWSLLLGLGHNAWSNGAIPIVLLEKVNAITPNASVSYWLSTLVGEDDAKARAAIVHSLQWIPDQPVAMPSVERQKRLAQIAACCALVPAFQLA